MLRSEIAQFIDQNREFVRLMNLIMNYIYPNLTYHEDNKTEVIKKANIFETSDAVKSNLTNNADVSKNLYFNYIYEVHDLIQKIIPLMPEKNEPLLRFDLFQSQSKIIRDFLKDRLVKHDLNEKVMVLTERQFSEYGLITATIFGYFVGFARSAEGHTTLDSEFTITFEMPGASDINLNTLEAIRDFLSAFLSFALRDEQEQIILNYETGSPKMEVNVKVKSDDIKADVRFDFNDAFNKLLESVAASDTSMAIKEAHRLLKMAKAFKKEELKDLKEQKKITGDDEFYKSEVIKVFDKYRKIKDLGLLVVANKFSKAGPRLLNKGVIGLLTGSSNPNGA